MTALPKALATVPATYWTSAAFAAVTASPKALATVTATAQQPVTIATATALQTWMVMALVTNLKLRDVQMLRHRTTTRRRPMKTGLVLN